MAELKKITDAQLQKMSVADINNKTQNQTGWFSKLTAIQKKYVAWTLNAPVGTNTTRPTSNPFNPNETGVSSKWLLSKDGKTEIANMTLGGATYDDLYKQLENASAPTQALFAKMVTSGLGGKPDFQMPNTYQDNLNFFPTASDYSKPGGQSNLPTNYDYKSYWNSPEGKDVYNFYASKPDIAERLRLGQKYVGGNSLTPIGLQNQLWSELHLDETESLMFNAHKTQNLLNKIYQNPNFQKYYATKKFDEVYDPAKKTFKTAPSSGALSVYHDNSSGYSAPSSGAGFQSAIGSQGAAGAQGSQGATTTPPTGQKKLTDAEQWVLALTKDNIKDLFPAGYNKTFSYNGLDGKPRQINLENHPKIQAYINSVLNGTASPYEARRVGYLANGSYHAPTLPPGVNFSIDAHLAADQVVYQDGQLVSKPAATTTTTTPSTTTTTVPPTTTTTVAPTTTTTVGPQGAQGAQGTGYTITLPTSPGGTGGKAEIAITIYGNKPKEGSLGAALKSVFPGLQTGKLSEYTKLIQSGELTPQQRVLLAQVLMTSGVNVNFKGKLGVAQNNELARALGVAFSSYQAAYKGATGKLRPLAGYFDDVLASGANLSMPLTMAQQAQLAAQQAAADAREARMQSSIDIVSEHLANMGFTGDQLKQLAPFVSAQVHSGLTQTAVYANLRRTPQYAQRFPGNAERLKLGKAVLAEGTYTAYEDRIAELSRTYGLPANALTAQTVGHMIANGVAPDEFEKRVVAGYETMQKADPSTLKMLQQYYNLNPGDIVHYIIDPKNGSAAIERKVSAAKLGASAADAGFQGVTSKQAEDFANFQTTKGVNVAQGIQQAGTMKGLMGTAPGQARQGLTQDQLLQGAVGTSTAAQQTLAGAQEAQAAPLKAGGGDVANQKGVIGAGYAAAE